MGESDASEMRTTRKLILSRKMPRELIVNAGPKGMVIILSPGGRHTVRGCTSAIPAHPKVKSHPKNAKAQVTAQSLQSPEYHGQVLSQYPSLILTLCSAPSHQRKFSLPLVLLLQPGQ